MEFNQNIHICFLSLGEFELIRKESNIPDCVNALVDSRAILIINFEAFLAASCSKDFYPTIRHEAIHILLGQYSIYLPFWLEEGICEYYSRKHNIGYINRCLYGIKLMSFYEMNKEEIAYVSQLNSFNEIQPYFYEQACSFVNFIINTISANLFWYLIKHTSIRRDFFQVLQGITGKSLLEYQMEWEKSINNYNVKNDWRY